MFQIKRFVPLAVLLFVCFFPLTAENQDWIIAAESFTLQDVSPVYENFSTIIPRLILSNIKKIGSRKVQKSELLARELQILSAERLRLIRERADLILTRDKTLLLAEAKLVRQRKKNEAENKILAKEKEIFEIKEKTKKLMAGFSSAETRIAPLKLWKNDNTLYTRPSGVTLGTSLRKDSISALITGTVQDIAGYMYVTASIETGIEGIETVSVSEAASYDDIEFLVSVITARLLPEIAKRGPVSIQLSVSPESARVFIDGHLIQDRSEPIIVFSGEHTITVSAVDYQTAERTARFEAEEYAVSIELQKTPQMTIAFDTGSISSSLFFHTQYFGETPQTVTLPSVPTIGEALSKDIPTWFIYRPDSQQTDTLHVSVKPNKITTEKRIERQRTVLYWSLGALYLSLPVSLLTYGIGNNKYQAYVDGKIPDTAAIRNEIETWQRASDISRGISIGLGINVAVQIVRYLIAADQATPQYAEQIKE